MKVATADLPATDRSTVAQAPARAHGRIVFANQLRGLAALCVVFQHLTYNYWLEPELVSAQTASPLRATPVPWTALTEPLPFRFGLVGVAIFFVISGFVIPFSVSRLSRAGFLLARAIRIFPVLVASMALGCLVVWFGARFWGRPYPFGFRQFVLNATLLHYDYNYASIDLVNWSLVIEVRFYLLSAVLAGAIRAGQAAVVVAASAAGCLLDVGLTTYGIFSVEVAVTTIHMLIFMLAGTLLYFHHREQISTAECVSFSFVQLVLFLVTWRFGVHQADFPNLPSYLAGYGIFVACYLKRNSFFDLLVLDGLASISFPLYLCHTLLGYSFLQAALQTTALPWFLALPLCVTLVVAAAIALHHLVERPTIRLIGRLKRRTP
ncbi:acyltransferase family protein [Aureimonas leprariae]|uniref:Acyltransferase n=1 Tax=Plantimonas leprariae TaxID=2615207 RepID=A0A7V7PK84_9HYPH|nr:acyltransferase [Aureimonas leprariae]KAB0676013.1 acyltransferase [Aureimonas leprariae]